MNFWDQTELINSPRSHRPTYASPWCRRHRRVAYRQIPDELEVDEVDEGLRQQIGARERVAWAHNLKEPRMRLREFVGMTRSLMVVGKN